LPIERRTPVAVRTGAFSEVEAEQCHQVRVHRHVAGEAAIGVVLGRELQVRALGKPTHVISREIERRT